MSKKSVMSFVMLAIAGIIVGFGSINEKEKVKVKCYYMAYACGDCYANYKIKEVIEGGSEIKKKLLDRDVKVTFKSKRLENRIDTLTGKCAICYDYYIEGYLEYRPEKEYSVLEADTCTVKLRNSKCCKD